MDYFEIVIRNLLRGSFVKTVLRLEIEVNLSHEFEAASI